MKDIFKIYDEEYKFKTYFQTSTGYYLRTSILDEKGKDTEIDPFMASFPHLLDIGIMGHCEHGLSGLCNLHNGGCYQNGGYFNKPNMSFHMFKSIIDQSEGKLFQIALGGRGDPDSHEEFERILSYSREKNIVPNLTTSGYKLDYKKASIIKEFCGAIAVSYYKTTYMDKALDLLISKGVKTNIHFILSNDSIDEAINILEDEKILDGVNRLVFLLYKPIGQGVNENVLQNDDKTKYLMSLIDTEYGINKIGFDSCTVPGILNNTKIIDPKGYDPCEAGRFSAYINAQGIMVPCSFDQELKYGESINEYSIREIWKGSKFNQFRNRMKNTCTDCPKWDMCMGGCPIVPQITLCDLKFEKEKI